MVVVKAYDQKGKLAGMGSGVRLPSGDVVTNYHVVKAGVRYTVGQGKQGVPATVKAGDPDKDLCLLTAPGLTAKPARLGKAARLKVGEPVYAVGAPQGLELSLSEGIVSQLRGGPPPLIQTTVAISGGSSGGGLFNAEGELVGITTFYLKDAQSLNFALPVDWIGEIVRRKTPERGAIVDDKAPATPGPVARPQEGWENRIVALEKARDWRGMLAWCRLWAKAEPGKDSAWVGLGVAYGKLGRYQEASEAYREALRLKPDNAITWDYLAFTYGNLGRYRESVEAYREALSLRPDDADAWNDLGHSYGKLGLYREGIEAFRKSLRLKPDDSKAWYNLGLTYGKMGRHSEAIEAYREAVRLNPAYTNAWYNLGVIYARSGNRSAALEAVKELRRYDPKEAEELFNLIIKP